MRARRQFERKSLPQGFEDVETLASFSPVNFCIFLHGDPGTADCLQSLSPDIYSSFVHEFGHLVHYCTSYMGLRDLQHWAMTISVLRSTWPKLTPEERVTRQAKEILSIARSKQILSIDDEYYYEQDPALFRAACAARDTWFVRAVGGRLFGANGKLSDHYFWGTRFFFSDGNQEHSFLRLPFGIRTFMEHMAKAIDFVVDAKALGGVQLLTRLSMEAYEPEMLHYYGLTHWVGPMIERQDGKANIWRAFLLAGNLVAVIADVPFDMPDHWAAVQRYAEKEQLDCAQFMEYPHPSFLFPVFLNAASKLQIDLGNYGVDGMNETAERILEHIGLPSLEGLAAKRDELLAAVLSELAHNELGQQVANLLRWTWSYVHPLSWSARLICPEEVLPRHPPVPLLFSEDELWEGTVLGVDWAAELTRCAKRRDEMLRYHFARDIVEENRRPNKAAAPDRESAPLLPGR